MSAGPSPAALAWRETGRTADVDGHAVFVSRGEGRGTPVLLLHGYPGSSVDFAGVLPALGAPWVAPDLRGFGYSAKPVGARHYSLFAQADLVEQVVGDLPEVAVLAHDMGTTVAAELLARQHEGRLGFRIASVVLTNGSIFIDLAQLTRGQRAGLRLGPRAMPLGLPDAVVRRSLRESIAPGTRIDPALDPAPLADLLALIREGRGDRVLVQQLLYLRERRVHQARWTAGFVDFAGPLAALWGTRDPIAVPAMPRRLADLRPGTDVVEWDDVGHWPSLEVPERLAEQVRARLAV
ncbi:alpha/beta fold hydrolase [Nocardioides sp.]|uniref:alpha/beta fold hydrolase n=1 Tax=Nocardioides sp. TaxID=35761 RepID=UPI0035170832